MFYKVRAVPFLFRRNKKFDPLFTRALALKIMMMTIPMLMMMKMEQMTVWFCVVCSSFAFHPSNHLLVCDDYVLDLSRPLDKWRALSYTEVVLHFVIINFTLIYICMYNFAQRYFSIMAKK